LVVVLLIALNLYSLASLIYPAFKPNQSETLTIEATPLDLTFLDSLRLTTSRVYPQSQPESIPKPGLAAKPGQVVVIEAAWQVLQTPERNYSVAASLLAPDGSVLAQRETYPGLGLRPTRYLQPGQTFVDRYPLHLSNTITEPIVARAALSLFDLETEARLGLPAVDANGNEVTPLVGQLKIVPAEWPTYQPVQASQVTFAEAITLLGYDPPSPEQPSLTLYWQSQAPVSEDYVVFVHLLDAAGNIIAQADAPPTQNAYPTSWWAPGEIIADRRALPEAVGVAALRLGLYQLDTGQRLPITRADRPTVDNAVELRLP
jgi:hypothetical protein